MIGDLHDNLDIKPDIPVSLARVGALILVIYVVLDYPTVCFLCYSSPRGGRRAIFFKF